MKGRRNLDRQAEAAHTHQLEQILTRLPYGQSVESRALRSLLRRVVGRGDNTGQNSGATFRGTG